MMTSRRKCSPVRVWDAHLAVAIVVLLASLILLVVANPGLSAHAAPETDPDKQSTHDNGGDGALPAGPQIQIENISPAILVDEDEIVITVRVSGLSANESRARIMTFMNADPFDSVERVEHFLDERPIEGWAADEIRLDQETLAAAQDEAVLDLRVEVDGSPLWNPAAWGPYGVTVRLLDLQEPGEWRIPQDQSILIWCPPGSEGAVRANVLLSGAFLDGAGLPADVNDFWVEGVTAQLSASQFPSGGEAPSDRETASSDGKAGGWEHPASPQGVLPKEVVLMPAEDADLSLLATAGADAIYEVAWDSYVEITNRASETAPFPVVENVIVASDDWLTAAVLRKADGATVLSGPLGLGGSITAQTPPSPLFEEMTSTGVARSLDSWVEGTEMLTEVAVSAPDVFKNLQKLRAVTALLATSDDPQADSDAPTFGLLGDGVDLEMRSVWVNVPFTSVPSNFADRLDALLNVPWVQPATLQEMLNVPVSPIPKLSLPDRYPPSQAALKGPLDQLSVEYRHALAVTEASPEPERAMEPLDEVTLAAVATGLTAEDRMERLDRAIAKLVEATDVVSVIPSQTVNVMGKNALFPVTVANSGPSALEVEVALEPEDTRLQVPSSQSAIIPAGGSVSIHVPVVAVGTGNIGVIVRASTPSGESLASSDRIDVRLLADWGDTFTLVIGIVMALLFVVGLVRTLRKGRRRLVLTPRGHAHERKS